MGYEPGINMLERHLTPRGYRMLRKIPRLPQEVIATLIGRFGHLGQIIDAMPEELAVTDGVTLARARDIKEGLNRLRELNLLERYG